jgi:hypothetical protein
MRAEYPERWTKGHNRRTGVYAVFLPTWRISESGKDLAAFPRLVLGDTRDAELMSSESKPAELGPQLYSQSRAPAG